MNYKCKGSTYITAEHISKLWKSKALSKVRQQRYLNKTKGVHELIWVLIISSSDAAIIHLLNKTNLLANYMFRDNSVCKSS